LHPRIFWWFGLGFFYDVVEEVIVFAASWLVWHFF